jgi:hypothetical protein
MTWTNRDHLRLSIRVGLTKGLRLCHGLRRQLSDRERDVIAEAIVDHLQLSRWEVKPGPPADGAGFIRSLNPKDPAQP